MAVKLHWSTNYVGIPWVASGRDYPNGLDCWGLVREVYENELGISLPSYPVDPDDARSNSKTITLGLSGWEKLDEPEDNCLVVMSKNRIPTHVGVYIHESGGLVLHTVEGQESLVDFIMDVRQNFKLLEFYRHGSFCNNNTPVQ